MKKNLRLFMLALLCAVAGTVWGTTYSHTFAVTDFVSKTSGSNKVFDGLLQTRVLDGMTWTISLTANHESGEVYIGTDNSKGLQIGSGSRPAKSVTLSSSSFSGTIHSIKINTCGASSTNAKFSVTVGGVQYDDEISLTNTATEYTFSGQQSGEIVLQWTQTSTKAIYIKTIEIVYGDGTSVVVDPPTFDPVSGTAVKAGDDVTITPASGCSLAYSVDGGNSYIQSAGTATYTITEPITIKAKSIDGDGNESSEVSAAYTISVGAPTFNPEPGSIVQSGSSVTITPDEDCKVSYTVNGGSAVVGELNQTVTVEITENTTIKARCIDAYGNKGSEVSAVYSLPSTGGDDGIITFEDELTTYSDWEFTNIERKKQASSPSAHDGQYYGTTTSGGNGQESASITTKDKISTPLSMKFYYTKTSSNTNSSSKFLIQVSSNGTDWIDVATGNTMNNVTLGTWYELSADLSSYSNVYVRACYSGSTGIRAIDDVELITGTQKAEPELAFNPTRVELNIGDAFTAPTLSYANGFDGTVTYSSSNTDVATVNTTTGEVTILDVVGSTTITASSQATDNFLAGEASYTIIVVDPNAVEHTATYLFKQDPYTTDYGSGVSVTSGSNEYVGDDGNGTVKTWISEDVTLVTDGKYRWKTNAMGYPPTDIRFHNNADDPTHPSMMKYSVPAGSLITKIEMKGTDVNLWVAESFDGTSSSATWNGSAQEVTFSWPTGKTSGNIQVTTVTITYTTAAAATTETISNPTGSEWITYCSTNDLSFEDLDVTPYIVVGVRKKADNSFVSLIQQIPDKLVPANTGILINMGSETEVNATVTTVNDVDLSGNLLIGVTAPTPVPTTETINGVSMTNFILANGENGLGFYESSGGSNLKAHRAYLQIPTDKVYTGTEANVIFIEEDATAINDVEVVNGTEGAWYTLSGVRVAQPTQKGVYINNGRKVVVK